MTSFDDLPPMSFGGEPGYQARQRVEISGVTLDERDALVIAAGGRIVRVPMQSEGLRPGRLLGRAKEERYYLIPDSAFGS
jgi:hypothetical protein